MKKITVINNAILQAISTYSAKAKKTIQEPDYVASMVLILPRLLNSSHTYPGVRFSGIFIHQSPKATFNGKYGNPSTCELGDLLVVCHNKVDGDDRYNSALIQWKKTDKASETITGNDLKQLDLYEHWPSFSLSSVKGAVFDIYPKTVSPGAQYGIIKSGTPEEFFSTIPCVNLTVQDAFSFARFLINFMKWHTGRPFTIDTSPPSDAWSLLITNLINVSLSKKFNRSNIGQVERDRVSCPEMLSLLTSEESVEIEISDKHKEEKQADGISILYIDMAPEQSKS